MSRPSTRVSATIVVVLLSVICLLYNWNRLTTVCYPFKSLDAYQKRKLNGNGWQPSKNQGNLWKCSTTTDCLWSNVYSRKDSRSTDAQRQVSQDSIFNDIEDQPDIARRTTNPPHRHSREERLADTADSEVRPVLFQQVTELVYSLLRDKSRIDPKRFAVLVRHAKNLLPQRPTLSTLIHATNRARYTAIHRRPHAAGPEADPVYMAVMATRQYHIQRWKAEGTEHIYDDTVLHGSSIPQHPTLTDASQRPRAEHLRYLHKRSSTDSGYYPHDPRPRSTSRSHYGQISGSSDLGDTASSTEQAERLRRETHAAFESLLSNGMPPWEMTYISFKGLVLQAYLELPRRATPVQLIDAVRRRRLEASQRGVEDRCDPRYMAMRAVEKYYRGRQLDERWGEPRELSPRQMRQRAQQQPSSQQTHLDDPPDRMSHARVRHQSPQQHSPQKAVKPMIHVIPNLGPEVAKHGKSPGQSDDEAVAPYRHQAPISEAKRRQPPSRTEDEEVAPKRTRILAT